MKDYPWNASRTAIKNFQKKYREWALDLPPELSKKMIRNLYKRHEPKEFVAFSLLCELLQHPNCPRDVAQSAYDKLLDLYLDLGICLAGLALRKELTPRQSMYLAERFFLDDIGDHALGSVVGNATSGHKPSHKLLLKLLKRDPSYDRDRTRWYIRSMLKQGSRKKTKKNR